MNTFWNEREVEDSFMGEDGLLHCSRCGGPLEVSHTPDGSIPSTRGSRRARYP